MNDDPYYLIRYSQLPEIMRRVAKVSDRLKRNPTVSVIEATTSVGISRSAYYKYKDAIVPFHATVQGKIVTLSLTLRDESGVLSNVLNKLASLNGNILTINQSLPLQGIANVIISMDTRLIDLDIDSVVEVLHLLDGVDHVAIVGQG